MKSLDEALQIIISSNKELEAVEILLKSHKEKHKNIYGNYRSARNSLIAIHKINNGNGKNKKDAINSLIEE